MSYRVFWSPDAEMLLEAIVGRATDVEQLTSAAKNIDRLLLSKPHDVGESRTDDYASHLSGRMASYSRFLTTSKR